MTRIISWNLLHKGGAELDDVLGLIHRHRPDLLLLQEATDHIERLPQLMGGFFLRTPLPGRRHGLAVWSPHEFHVPPRIFALQPGLFVDRVCQLVELDRFAVANVHLSHGQFHNRRQLRRIADRLPARAAILGDCNLVGPPLLPGFRDVGPAGPTHAMSGVMPVRLDRCFVRGMHCTESAILDRGPSDHHPIAVRLVPEEGVAKRPVHAEVHRWIASRSLLR